MNNIEKKSFILSIHTLYMETRPYDDNVSLDNMKAKEDAMWNEYLLKYNNFVPKTLFKYRKPTEEAIRNFENNEAWFSHPADFGDTVDSSIDNDIDEVLDEFEKNPQPIIKKMSAAFISKTAETLGIKVDVDLIDKVLPLFNSDGNLNEEETRLFLDGKMPPQIIDSCVERLKLTTKEPINTEIKESFTGFMNNYLNMNKSIRTGVFTFCLAEENDNQAMWELYADGCTGFCIEYEFPIQDFLAQRILLNLFPVYYGEKPKISFVDVLIRGIYSSNKINGIDYSDYQDWFLSTFTKDKSYEFQKEWRIVFDNNIGKHLQSFPFVKSVILGERMTEENKQRIIESAKKKNIPVYERRINRTESRVTLFTK